MASVVCVSESKLQVVNPFVIGETFGTHFDGFVYLPVVGTVGGVVVDWASEDVHVISSRIDKFSVSINLTVGGGKAWWLTAVYGPSVDTL